MNKDGDRLSFLEDVIRSGNVGVGSFPCVGSGCGAATDTSPTSAERLVPESSPLLLFALSVRMASPSSFFSSEKVDDDSYISISRL